jgi:hypothetical protein
MRTTWKDFWSDPKQFFNGLKIILQILVLVGGVFLVNSAFEKARTAYVEAETNATIMETQRLERESNENSKYMLYDAVVKSLESKNPIYQEVVKKLVITSPDSPFRNGLFDALATSTNPQIKKDVIGIIEKEKVYAQENIQIDSKAVSDRGWDYDIFWCEQSDTSAQKSAQQIAQHLNDKKASGDDTIGRVRVRMLPDSINAQPGYRISGNLIRYDESESKQAQALQQSTNAIVPFDLSLSRMNTKWYLSAFICPN